ncbi:MAG: DUF362 domain-containing protein [bacterium]
MKGEFYRNFLAFSGAKRKKNLSRLNRRSFLKTTSLAIAGLSVPRNVCFGRPKPVFPPPAGEALVSIVRRPDIEDMVRTAIDLAGGFHEINPGETVVIKPNITCRSNPDFDGIRVVTSPDVLRSVIRAVKERTDRTNITVADACAFGFSTREAARSYGLYDVCLEEGVNFSGWEEEKYISFTHKGFFHVRSKRKIPASLSSFNHFINVPILKNHEMVPFSNAGYTCCLKNFVGLISPYNRLDLHTRDLGEKVAELNLCVPNITMNIVDALTVILTDGPAGSAMDIANPGLVLASKDRVACDSLALAVLKYYASRQGIERDYVHQSVWEQSQIRRASQLGLGRVNPDLINIIGDGVEEIEGLIQQWC